MLNIKFELHVRSTNAFLEENKAPTSDDGSPNDKPTSQSLVKWQGQPIDDDKWLDDDLKGQFPCFSFKDKVVFKEGGNYNTKEGPKAHRLFTLEHKSRIKKIRRGCSVSYAKA